MLELIKQELQKQKVFEKKYPVILEKLVKSIPNNLIPRRMKLTIAVSEFILFASQFRRNILHWNGSSIPINSISFSIAKSGDGKDSAVSAVRKCFSIGYDKLEEKREEIAIETAIDKAARDGVEYPNSYDEYSKFLLEPTPLFVAPSTVEGFIQHLNFLDEDGTGAGFIYSGEFGSELVTSPVIISNLQLLAEIYDEGRKEVKMLKNRENQSKEIMNLPVSALFVGSQDNILFDDTIKRKFKTEFTTKLARRSFFNFNKEQIEPIQYDSVEEMLKAELEMEELAEMAKQDAQKDLEQVAQTNLDKIGEEIAVSDEVRELFTLYKRYNLEVSNTISAQYPISILVRKHLQWKALKLAGAIAFYDESDIITKDHYIQAISFVELLDEDMMLFEQELVKEPYELFVSYMHSIANGGEAEISLHQLKKMGYITGSGSVIPKLKELIHLATSYDEQGIYTERNNGIHLQAIVKTDIVGASCLNVTGDKEERARNCSKGYNYGEYTFPELGEMLMYDLAYSPFKFKDGTRGKEYIEGGCKWICLDIDHSSITDEECHYILQDFNHHIVRTSNGDNPFRFRVLLELDSIVDIDDKLWKDFTDSIAQYLGLVADKLPKSQIFFSYSGRNIMSVTDKKQIEVKEHIVNAQMKEQKKTPNSSLSSSQKDALLNDPLTTFEFAYDANKGERSISLIRAAKYARDLGMDKEEIIELMNDINTYWPEPLEETRFQSTIINQIERW